MTNPYAEANRLVAEWAEEAEWERSELDRKNGDFAYCYGFFKGKVSIEVALLLKRIQELEKEVKHD
jgi:hypothetical protein